MSRMYALLVSKSRFETRHGLNQLPWQKQYLNELKIEAPFIENLGKLRTSLPQAVTWNCSIFTVPQQLGLGFQSADDHQFFELYILRQMSLELPEDLPS